MCSTRQKGVALSTAEAEIYALLVTLRRLVCTRRIIAFVVGYALPATSIREDNKAVVAMLKRRDLSWRSRHMRINIGFIIDAMDADEITVDWVPSQDQIANTLTAAEDRVRFLRNRAILLGGL